MNPTEYAFHGGSVPIFLENSCLIGAVTISGLDQVSDHRIASELLRKLDAEQ